MTAATIVAALSCGAPGCTPCAAAVRDGHGKVHCPAHADAHPSLSVDEKHGKPLVYCHAGCTNAAVIDALRRGGLWAVAQARDAGSVRRWPYIAPDGTVLGVHARRDPPGERKRMWFEHPDGRPSRNGEITARKLPLYNAPALRAAPADALVLLVEGEPCADAAAALGFVAVSLAGGASQKADDFGGALEELRGRAVVLLPDNDPPGRTLMQRVAQALAGVARTVRTLVLPDLPSAGDIVDWLAAGGTADALRALAADAPAWQPTPPDGDGSTAEGAPAPQPRSLAEVEAVARRWLYLPSLDPLYAVLGAVAANYAAGDPLWLMVVGASSGGKTELLNAVSGLPSVHAAATITESALLSGTPQKDKATGARGGLLREIGAFGILVLKDFTSILSMNRDPRAALLAALRELYDGAWTRHVGVDGGRTLRWDGKIGLVAGSTAAIDAHHAVIAVCGERFLLFRLPEVDAAKQARRALRNTGHEAQMRRELREAVAGLFASLDLSTPAPALDDDSTERLIALASLTARCRSAVERDGRSREIELILDAEAPARLAQALLRLYGGLQRIGLDPAAAWRVVTQTGFDSVPKIRRAVFDALRAAGDWRETPALAAAVGYPSGTARRALEDLAVHRVVERRSGGKGKPDSWRLSAWAAEQVRQATVPEMSVDTGGGEGGRGERPLIKLQRIVSDFSGTVPDPPFEAGADERATRCWQCKTSVDSDSAATCAACGWLVCGRCGSCSEDCSRTETANEPDELAAPSANGHRFQEVF